MFNVHPLEAICLKLGVKITVDKRRRFSWCDLRQWTIFYDDATNDLVLQWNGLANLLATAGKLLGHYKNDK